jgi:hypothetical protein
VTASADAADARPPTRRPRPDTPDSARPNRQPRQPGPAMEPEQVSVPAMTGHGTALHLRPLGRASAGGPSSTTATVHARTPARPLSGPVVAARPCPVSAMDPTTGHPSGHHRRDPGRVRTDGGRLCPPRFAGSGSGRYRNGSPGRRRLVGCSQRMYRSPITSPSRRRNSSRA